VKGLTAHVPLTKPAQSHEYKRKTVKIYKKNTYRAKQNKNDRKKGI
jgi:hypothetical protein